MAGSTEYGFIEGMFVGRAKSEAAMIRGDSMMYFDWDKAAQIIKERGATNAEAGLGGDWDHTGGPIWQDGKIVDPEDTYTYLGSLWAVPELDVDGELIECYTTDESMGWDEETYWPDSARAIVSA